MKGITMRAAGVLLLAGWLAGCGGVPADGAEGERDTFVRVINVEVAELQPRAFVEEIRLTGVVRADRDVMVSAQESGVIRQVLAEKGRWIEEGNAIAKIDDEVLQAQVAQAQAQADLASQTWARRKVLWEEDRVGSEITYLEAKFAAEQTAANLRALAERLRRTTIRAPFSGVLDDRMVEVGTMVNPGDPVARVVDRTPVKIVAGVPERYAAEVRIGAEAQVSFDVFPGRVFSAPITYVSATVNPQNRTFLIEVRMDNPEGMVKPEMVANVLVARRAFSEAIVVPQDALVRVENGYVAFVAQDGPQGPVAAVRPVVVGPAQRNQVVIDSGLEPGDRLIVVGHKAVADGDRVSVVNEAGQG